MELFSSESVISIINLEINNGLLKKCSREDFNFARLVKILLVTVGDFNCILKFIMQCLQINVVVVVVETEPD